MFDVLMLAAVWEVAAVNSNVKGKTDRISSCTDLGRVKLEIF